MVNSAQSRPIAAQHDLLQPPDCWTFWLSFIGASIVFSFVAFWQTYLQMEHLGIVLWKSKWILLFLAYVLNIVLGTLALIRLLGNREFRLLDLLERDPRGAAWKSIGAILALAGLLLIWPVRWRLFHNILPEAFPALWVFWWGTLLAALGVKWLTGRSWATAFLSALALQGVVFVTYGRLRLVSNFPFSMGYSESSRYYYASLYFSRQLYGTQLPLSPLHPSRYLLMSIPFLIQALPLWVHRLWQALLYIGLTAGSSYALARRLCLGRAGMALLAAAWFYLYCFEGIIYYHLQLMVIIVLLGVQPRHPWRSLIAILVASFWAGISRINWFPVPALLAATLYFLEQPAAEYKNIVQYAWKPVLWVFLGTAVALASQAWYIVWSGNGQNPELFGSSFSSALLWYRLWPNASFSLGILPGIVIVSAPLWLAIYFAARGRMHNLHWLRWLALAAICLVLFVGGLVVSVKIGGGAELHDMDAYMVILGTIAAYTLADRVAPEAPGAAWGGIPWPVALAAFVVPVSFAMIYVIPYGIYNQAAAREDIRALQQAVDQVSTQANAQGGQVLFIGDRQLLTFHMIHGVTLVPDYELVTLMEVAMSHNTDYLNRFYADLRQHRFALIVARKQGTSIQDTDEAFADENNAWNTAIAAQLLCNYEPIVTLKTTSLQVYAPRPRPTRCP